MSIKARLTVILAVAIVVGILLVLSRYSSEPGGLKAAFTAEFIARPDGYKGVSQRYAFEFASTPLQMDPGLMYSAAARGDVDVVCAFATDGRIPAYDLLVLEDDKSFFPPYYAAPLVRGETLEKYPQIEEILNRLAGRISNESMQKLNYESDELRRKPGDMAREFLLAQGLLGTDAKKGDGSAGTVTIGSKAFTEQLILGELMAMLIEYHSDIKVVRKLSLAGTMICFSALKVGDIDMYPEYTGTGLVTILKQEAISDPDEVYELVHGEFQKKWGLAWLKPFGFNNTYTLTMRRKHAEELGIKTISGLAKYIESEQKGEQK